MKRSVLMVGSALLLAAPAQAGGVPGGPMNRDPAHNNHNAPSGFATVSVPGMERANPVNGHGDRGTRVAAGASVRVRADAGVRVGEYRQMGMDNVSVRGLGRGVALAGSVRASAVDRTAASVGGARDRLLNVRVGGSGHGRYGGNLASVRVGDNGHARNLATVRLAGSNNSVASVKIGGNGDRLATVKVGGRGHGNRLATVRVGGSNGHGGNLATIGVGGNGHGRSPATVRLAGSTSVAGNNLASVRVGGIGNRLATVRVGGNGHGNRLATVEVGGNGSGHNLATVKVGTAGAGKVVSVRIGGAHSNTSLAKVKIVPRVRLAENANARVTVVLATKSGSNGGSMGGTGAAGNAPTGGNGATGTSGSTWSTGGNGNTTSSNGTGSPPPSDAIGQRHVPRRGAGSDICGFHDQPATPNPAGACHAY